MKITLIVGGMNHPSNSETLADAFLEGAQRVPGMMVEKRCLRETELHHFTIDDYKTNATEEPAFTELRTLIQGSDGFVFATPIWNFGVPANMKNFIDRMGSFGLDTDTRSKGTLGGKPFYLILTGGAPKAAWLGMMQKTTSFVQEGVRYFGAVPIGTHFEERCTKGKGQFGLVIDQRPDSLKSVREKGEAFGRIVQQFAKTGQLPMGKTLYRKAYEFGRMIMGKM